MNWLGFALFWIHVIFVVPSLFISLLPTSQHQYILNPHVLPHRKIWKSKKSEDLSTPHVLTKETVGRASTGFSQLQLQREPGELRRGTLASLGHARTKAAVLGYLEVSNVGFRVSRHSQYLDLPVLNEMSFLRHKIHLKCTIQWFLVQDSDMAVIKILFPIHY